MTVTEPNREQPAPAHQRPQRVSEILVDPPATRVYAWAAWSAWRGEPKRLAQMFRQAMRELCGRRRQPHCSIEVLVRGDIELFESPEDFVQQVSRDTLMRLSAIRLAVGDRTLSVSLTLARRNLSEPFVAYRGVLLEVRAGDDGEVSTVEAIAAALRPSVSRGQFSFSTEPRKGVEPDVDKREVLRELHRSRVGSLFVAITPMLGLSAMVTLLLVAPYASIWVWTLIPMLGSLVVAAVMLVAPPRSLDVLFPAIDIADTTPGRRLLRRLSALPLVPLGTFLVKEFVEKQ